MVDGTIITGVASGGTNNTLYDLNKNWLPGQWKDAIVEIVIGNISYRREITENGINSLTFEALPSGVTVSQGNAYFITSPMSVLKRVLEETLRKITEASVDTGIADDTSTVNYLDDSSKNWPTDAFVNLIVEITEGTGLGQFAKIASNTATRLTFVAPMPVAPDATSHYRIGFYGKMAGDITHWGGMSLTGRDISLDLARLDITISALRDALRGAATKDLSTLEADVESVLAQLDVALSTRASQATLASVLAQLDITLSALRDAICAAGADAKNLNNLYTALTGYSSGSATGTTTNAYADAVDWGVAGIREKTIVLANTGANGLHYKVLVRAVWAGQVYEEVAETTLAAGARARVALNNAYARIVVQVKAAVAGSQTSYQIDFIGHLS